MVSRRQRFWNGFSRAMEKPLLGLVSNQKLLRVVAGIHSWTFYRRASDMRFLPIRIGSNGHYVPAIWCDRGEPPLGGVILYFHGGAYTVGGPGSHKHWVAQLAAIAGMRGLLVDYRLAPEHPFPAAQDDALAAYKGLLERGYAPDQIILAGDSAGAGLAFSLLARLQSEGLNAPLGVVGFSPWADLRLTALSLKGNARSEMMVPLRWLKRTAPMYAGSAGIADPGVSPVLAEYSADTPPCLIMVGAGEILADDARAMATRLRAAGAEVTHIETEDVGHIWPIRAGLTPEADAANDRAGAFMRRLWNQTHRKGADASG